MNQREFTRVCNLMSRVSLMLAESFKNARRIKKLKKLSEQFRGMGKIKINQS